MADVADTPAAAPHGATVACTTVAIRRDDLRATRTVETQLPTGQGVILRVEHFALTANNVTYAAFGDRMSYWDFFPVEAPWGCVPVWGFGVVIASSTPGVDVGERFYGYFPMASHLRVQPENVGPAGFTDGSPHRRKLTAGYNQYYRTTTDTMYGTAGEAEQMLLRPLFLTGFTIDDYLFDNAYFGARRILLSSASSKTALAAAFLLRRREDVEVVGLTSPGNLDVVRDLDCYNRVLSYSDLDAIAADEPVCYVDMAGNGPLREAIHYRFQDGLKLSCAVGATHWDQMEAPGGLPGPKPLRFFVPSQVGKRVGEWGGARFQQVYLEAWLAFLGRALDPANCWFEVRRSHGAEAIVEAWRSLVDGRTDGRRGTILSVG